ncbi:YjfA family protein [Metabacillus dongyingensis]
MKKLKKKIGLSIIMTLSMVFVSFGFGASQTSAENHSYDGKSPYYNSCASSAVTKDKVWIDSVSYVELKYSTTCKTAWAKVSVTRPAVYNHEADARIIRSTDGKAYTCSSSGGNGVVNKGQTSCYTPMVYDLDPRKAQAQGIHAIPNSDAYKKAVTIWY